MSEQPKRLSGLESRLELHFQDPALLREALTHSSYVNEYRGADQPQDNERLEFLGDAVLDIVVADLLFRRFPIASEGDLSQLRAALIRTESLARVGMELGLGACLLIGHGEERSGGRNRQRILCQATEALIAAIYLDRGLTAVANFIAPRLLIILDEVIASRLHIDARSELNERIQARLNIPPEYEVIGESGPEHDKEYRIAVAAAGTVLGTGAGPSKQSAAQAAAADALRRLDGGDSPERAEKA